MVFPVRVFTNICMLNQQLLMYFYNHKEAGTVPLIKLPKSFICLLLKNGSLWPYPCIMIYGLLNLAVNNIPSI